MVWLLLVLAFMALLASRLRIRRYCATHVVGQLTVRGCGLYFSRTADGTWWRLRARPHCDAAGSTPDEPPAAGVREPRRPRGPRPRSSAAAP